ncbi:MAG: FG-GAP-like repeat-containing protein [Terriglobia bacterium]
MSMDTTTSGLGRNSLLLTIGGIFALTAVLLLRKRLVGAAEPAAALLPQSPGRAATPAAASFQTLRNRGKAYYEQGKYTEAIQQFQKAAASGRAVALDHLDLGQALLQTNRLNEALEELTTAKQMSPHLLAIDYNLGILYKHELRYPDAEAALKLVIQSDPNDPPTWFNLGSVYFSERKMAPSLDAYRRVVDMGFAKAQNFYVAATFHCFTILTRLQKPGEAKRYLQLNAETRDKVPNLSLQYPALEAGKYGMVRIPPPTAVVTPASAGALRLTFQEIASKVGLNVPARGTARWISRQGLKIKASEFSLGWARTHILPLFSPSVAVTDYDGDGRPDLFVVIPGSKDYLFHQNADGTFTDVTAKAGVAGDGSGVSAEFIDYTNSGHPSLFVAGLGGVRVYENNGNGTFTDATEKTGLKGQPGELDTRILAVDTDNDGFLDLIVTAYADFSSLPVKPIFLFPADVHGTTSHLYRNDGDGTFKDITATSGLAATRGRMRGAVFADFNNDGYMDLLFYRDNGPPLLFLNQGEDHFVDSTASAGPDLAAGIVTQAQVSDLNHDGWFDLVLWTPQGYRILMNRGRAQFKRLAAPEVKPPSGLFRNTGTLADVDGDSFDDILAPDSKGGWHWIRNRGGKFEEAGDVSSLNSNEPVFTLLPALVGGPGKLNLVGFTASDAMAVFEREGSAPHWVVVNLDGYKSNKQGAGDIVELKAGDFYDKVIATGGPVRVFTGNLDQLDVVRVTWPNQVVQNSVDVAANTSLRVRESERLASSCPFLYVWNGQRYVFFTDIMGVAPLGELSPDGTIMKPNPEELVRLGSDLHPRHGKYVFQITDEMREVDYFDQLRLLAVDHPASEDVYSNEIYSSRPKPPQMYVVRHKRFPVSAVDDRGKNVLPLILKADGRYPTGFHRDRILGLGNLHSLTLDLGSFPTPSQAALWLKGWVLWTDSNASRALMSNRKLQMTSPYLQVRDRHGKWVTVIPDMGLPSGTNRTMMVDLTGKFKSNDHHVRVVTNFCVYWDQIFFTTEQSPAPAPTRLPLVAADLHYRGFSAYTTDINHIKPDHFDYARRLVNAPWNPALGHFTRYGPVGQLLSRADDEVVAMSTGDEMTVEFDAQTLPPLKPGWRRDFFLYARGYAKDGEPNTAAYRTVEPLPFREMSNYPPWASDSRPRGQAYADYLRTYQTRRAYELIPRLAPAVRNP